jgi:hypothetical protein
MPRISELPNIIEEFFRLKNAEDDEALPLLFTDDATVIDAGERKEMHGRDQISQWIGKSISGLHLQTYVRGWKEEKGEWIVDTALTGNFKASPAHFEYFISLVGDKISKLRVEFRGSLKK